MSFYGMDTAQGEDFASLLGSGQGAIVERADQLTAVIGSIDSMWRGPDAENFRSEWTSLRSGQIDQVTQRLAALVQEMLQHVQEQDTASGGGETGGGSGGDDGFDWGDVFRIGPLPGISDLLPNDWEDWVGLGTVGILDGLSGAYAGLAQHFGNPRMLATMFMAGGDDLLRAGQGIANSANAWSRGLGAAGAVVSGGFAAWDRWEADANDPSLSTGERVARSAVDGALNAGGGALGGWGGAAAGMAIGTAIFPGVGTVIGGAIGGIAGGLAGGTAGNGLADWLLG